MADIDPTFAVNDYNKPKMLSVTETYVNNILMLLFGKKGFYPSIPSIGMDIQQYLYMFEDDINENAIKMELASQCADFLPEIETGNLDVYKATYNNHSILIFQLPIIENGDTTAVSVGVTTNNKGELIYKFVEGNYQVL